MTPSWADSSRIVRPSSQPGRFHGTHATAPPQISSTSFSPSAAQARAMTLSGCRWSTCVLHQCVHRGVDRRSGTAGSVPAVGEQADHVVLVLDAAVDAVEPDQTVAFEYGETVGGQGAQVAAGAST